MLGFFQNQWRWEDGSSLTYPNWERQYSTELYQCIQISSQGEKRAHTHTRTHTHTHSSCSLWCLSYRIQGLVQSSLQRSSPVCVSGESTLLVTAVVGMLTDTDTALFLHPTCSCCIYLHASVLRNKWFITELLFVFIHRPVTFTLDSSYY